MKHVYPLTPFSKKHWFFVKSPEYEVTVPLLDDGSGPTEIGLDMAIVQATSKRKAIARSVKFFREKYGTSGYHSYSDPNENPFEGLKAEVVDDNFVRQFFNGELREGAA